MRKILISIILFGFIFSGCSDKALPSKSALIEDIGELAISKDKIEFVLSRKDLSFFSKIKGAWIIKGDAILSTNLKNATIQNEVASKTTTITLDKPSVIIAGIDHKRTKIDEVIKGFFTSEDEESTFRDNLMKDAQEEIVKIANNPNKILLAKERTEKIINSYYKKIGWHTKIIWRD